MPEDREDAYIADLNAVANTYDGTPPSFADILTTASAVSHFLGERVIRLDHVAKALDIQTGVIGLLELGKPLSPLVQRFPPGTGPSVEEAVRDLAQRWYTELGGQATEQMTDEQIAQLRAELVALKPGS